MALPVKVKASGGSWWVGVPRAQFADEVRARAPMMQDTTFGRASKLPLARNVAKRRPAGR